MIRATLAMMYGMFYGCVLLIFLFCLLCMNVFTIPLFFCLYLLCKLFKGKCPRLRMYGLMGYPSWSSEPGFKLANTIGRWSVRQERKAKEKMRRRFYVTHAWEERVFM